MAHAYSHKRCYCMAQINKFGKCPHGCDPALKAPHKSRMQANRRAIDAARKELSEKSLPTKREVAIGAAKAMQRLTVRL